MAGLPFYIAGSFIITTLLALAFLYKAARGSKAVLLLSLAWLGLQGAIGLSGFYTVTTTVPPRLGLLLLPPLMAIIICFVTKGGRYFIDSLTVKWLTILHVVRVPVELVLVWLFAQKYVPQLMTFEGRNFDVVSGLTAPVIFYFGYVRRSIGRNILLGWNLICLLLLLNIVINAVLSAPGLFQRFAFDQPNVAILYFPFVWLPSFIVPVVLLAHLASIRRLLKSGNTKMPIENNFKKAPPVSY